MTETPTPDRLHLSDLSNRRPTEIDWRPDSAAQEEIARRLGLVGLRKMRLTGRLSPLGKRDWSLDATLGATVVQSCVVTLEPVTTRIDEPLERQFLADWHEPEGEEVEMPEEVDAGPLPEVLDLASIAEEALALALPPYPRAEGAELGSAVFAEPGTEPLTDEAAKPFAALAGLKEKLGDDDGDDKE